ncbi:pyruvate formate lyase activating enzyme [Tepiditoga spiralis]|uniref:Pyruvate formate lyase activating enzyme n=1 Tax=Tepiditoga spiralis TaxID=2108365 RepID=A0A7G1G5K1_9BACT|nr:radical SAM protein [Tepiditoga spiralis]BBE31395.1 pyruvate formate lyase activating enzyme [Tepiditoga spiralis]
MPFEPSYIKLYKNGELHKRRDELYKKLTECDLCPINCKVNRKNNIGFCLANDKIKISEYVLYPGEEPPLTGSTGAGGVFFSGCNMKCIYCQNFKFSQEGNGKYISVKKLKEIFLELQNEKKASNLDLITATPYLPFIFDALIMAIEEGFKLPIVWNTSSYEKQDTLKYLKDVVDIYLADIRYTSNIIGKKYSKVDNYWTNSKKSLIEMYNQISNDFIIENNILKRGIILRILVLPNNIRQAKEALKFIKYDLSEDLHISLMDQYVPVYKARETKELSRFLKREEYDEVVELMKNLELKNGWIQHHKLLGD